jgi:hypothetical protein
MCFHLGTTRAENTTAAFVIPQIISPKFDRHLQEVANSQVPFTHLFDQDHFVAALGSACPQLKIYNHTNELWELPSTAKSYTLVRIYPSQSGNDRYTCRKSDMPQLHLLIVTYLPPFASPLHVTTPLSFSKYEMSSNSILYSALVLG